MTPEEKAELIRKIGERKKEKPVVHDHEDHARAEALGGEIEAEANAAMDREEIGLVGKNPLGVLAALTVAAQMSGQEPMRPKQHDLTEKEVSHKRKAKIKRDQEKSSRKRNRK